MSILALATAVESVWLIISVVTVDTLGFGPVGLKNTNGSPGL